MESNDLHAVASDAVAAGQPAKDTAQPPASTTRDPSHRMKIYRIQTAKLLSNGELAVARPLGQMEVPLCSFGPGGEYVVDWYAHRYRPQQLDDQDDSESEIYSPLKLLFREMRDVFLGIHPGRRYRSEARPDLLEPCPLCRQDSQYSPWTSALRPAKSHQSLSADKSDKAVTYPQPVLATLPVRSANAEKFPLKAMANGGRKKLNQSHIMENAHDTNAETTGDSYRYPRLPAAAGLFADDAGTGRPARRIQGHRVRARSGSGAKKTYSSGAAQGTLFDCTSGSEAA